MVLLQLLDFDRAMLAASTLASLSNGSFDDDLLLFACCLSCWIIDERFTSLGVEACCLHISVRVPSVSQFVFSLQNMRVEGEGCVCVYV